MAAPSTQARLLSRLPSLSRALSLAEHRHHRDAERGKLALRLSEVLKVAIEARAHSRWGALLPLLDESGKRDAPLLNLTFRSDLVGNEFHERASVIAPNLVRLSEGPDGSGFTHLMLQVGSSYFGRHHEVEYEVVVRMGERVLDRRLFQKWYAAHSFLLPLHLFAQDSQEISLTATVAKGDDDEEITLTVDAFACSESAILDRLARGSIWLFSTARSGSTWLAADLLCANDRARLIDESGIGRMFAPLQIDPERFFSAGDGWRSRYVESGFDFETGSSARAHGDRLPVFERAFVRMDRENQILRRQNFEFYHGMLREFALKHAINEWGCHDFDRVVFKCPNESHGADFIMRAFPDARMVFLMRDGRDVMRSRFSPFASPLLAANDDPALRHYAIAYYSHLWNFQVDIIRTAFDAHPAERRLFLKYEDLRLDPKRSIADVLYRTGFYVEQSEVDELAQSSALENVPADQRGPDKPRQDGLIGGFHTFFDEAEIELMNTIMGPNLKRYGYLA